MIVKDVNPHLFVDETSPKLAISLLLEHHNLTGAVTTTADNQSNIGIILIIRCSIHQGSNGQR
jgi:hypothetical protein